MAAPGLSGAYHKDGTRLLHVVDDMRALGAERELALPTIVICGSQSVGKSSIVESLCNVKLPRNKGEC